MTNLGNLENIPTDVLDALYGAVTEKQQSAMTPTITSDKVEWAMTVGCTTCEVADALGTMPFIPHNNCLYNGNASGHRAAHCTADSCY